jgi:hypothetical protein
MADNGGRPEKMPRSELRIEFAERKDREGNKYYLAKTELPMTISLEDTAFFLWPGDAWKEPSMTVVFNKPKKGSQEPEEEEGEGK